MQVKSLRLHKNWSQEQLAQLSGLSVRTIQRIERGDNVGLETLKALAAVFEVDVNHLKSPNNNEHELFNTEETATLPSTLKEKETLAHEKVQSIKEFYMLSMVLIGIFLFLPNYNQGENLGQLIVVAISFVVIIGAQANAVFQPFGEKWEQKKFKQLMNEQDNNIKDLD